MERHVGGNSMKISSLVFALAALLAAPRAWAGSAELFALIVTNNRSATLERPDLQYADDDGVRYHALFSSVADADHVRLIARLDRATASVHPDVVPLVQPPRRAEVLAALSDMRERVMSAHAAGKRTRFYFVYAGHGDMEGGAGYLDLEDGRMDAAFLENEIVDRVPADEQHIVLDSCNSFFVVNPRKPGGKRWATPRDMALGFANRHPNVGLFLSTNSEAEVYEWSEIESGIFSHEVRSGLSGAADVNGDGTISYAELGGFIERANANLPRANVRPQIFYRGPAGDAGTALFDISGARGRRLALGPSAQRLWVRGAAGERLVDLHKEEGELRLVIPGSSEQALSVVEWQAATLGAPPVLREYAVPAGNEPVTLAQLQAESASSTARGGAAIFGELFTLPYGARSFAAYQADQAKVAEPVYGISATEEARMRHYLTTIARSDNETRRNFAWVSAAIGLVGLSASVPAYWATPRWEGQRTFSLAAGGGGLAFMGAGLYLGLTKSLGQNALDTFNAELQANAGNPALAVAKTESFLDDLARRERRTRQITGGFLAAFGLAFAAGGTAALALGHDNRERPTTAAIAFSGALYMGIAAWRIGVTELPTERLLRMYHEDPDLKLRVGPVPVPGGMGLGMAGQF
jgi:hypothetical protein